MPLALERTKVYAFVDGAFANKKDMTSQIGIVMVLATETTDGDSFILHGNTFHWTSVKCRRVTRAVLASELYAMVLGVDVAISVGTTLDRITKQLGIAKIPVVVCTDSFSLYECMVKLGTTKEKRLMIDIMAIRQSYERREITEIRWINGQDNPADAMTKVTPNKALATLIATNKLKIRVQGWVQRSTNSTEDSNTTNSSD